MRFKSVVETKMTGERRKSDPDYSHCIPHFIQIQYYDPKGQLRHVSRSLKGDFTLSDLSVMFGRIASDAHAPLHQGIFKNEFE